MQEEEEGEERASINWKRIIKNKEEKLHKGDRGNEEDEEGKEIKRSRKKRGQNDERYKTEETDARTNK